MYTVKLNATQMQVISEMFARAQFVGIEAAKALSNTHDVFAAAFAAGPDKDEQAPT